MLILRPKINIITTLIYCNVKFGNIVKNINNVYVNFDFDFDFEASNQ